MSENTLSTTKFSKGLMNAVLIPLITTAFLCMALYLAWPRFLPILTENLKDSTNIDIADWKTFQGALDKRLQAIETEMAKVGTTNEVADWKTFQNSLGERLQAIEAEMAKVGTTNEMADWKAFQSSLGERLQAIEAEMANIRTIEAELGTLSGETTELANSLAWILLSNERSEAKAAELLKLAAEFKDANPGKAALYYWAALEASPNKKGILNEYIAWQEDLIETDIRELDFTPALDRLTETAALMDANLYKGTLEDLQAFDELGGRLADLGNSINLAVDAEAATQVTRLDAWAAELEQAAPDQKSAYEKIIAALEQFKPMPQNTDRAEALHALAMDNLQNFEAVESLSLDKPDIITPASADKATAERWLSAYTNRLTSKDISLENRLLGAEIAQMYLTSVTDDIDPVFLDQLAKAEGDITIALWKEASAKAVAEIGDANPDTVLATLGSLYAQGQAYLSEAPDDEIITNLTDMASKVFLAQLAQVRDAMNDLQSSEGRYENEILQQLAAQYRMQAAGIAMEFQKMSAKLPALASSNVEEEIQGIIVAANNLTAGFGKKVQQVRFNVEDEAVDNFRKYFNYYLEQAQDAYDSAEKIAAELTSTWGNDMAQIHLRNAYRQLLHINPDDVGKITDQAKKDKYNVLKHDIVTNLNPANARIVRDEEIVSKTYEDFRREAEQGMDGGTKPVATKGFKVTPFGNIVED